ncbi:MULTISPECIES: 5-oxoprolinase subunit PxpB [Rahnella]|uniref:5-oxoprolinase subunit PxpB n=1 Tax=Rahnella sp. (strain Y9602) TaxID=2703885 RepID=A0A0H3FIK5_RAHSY|nr:MULTISPECIES: 5-oxoprolinase subunit PxpB [Rahnella]AFE59401.1 allophanate hydrolase subunit 1 [Rahnella aquatilis HX2]MCM2445360.1 5-oxoprolinase subunit PxpB [Rahnella sp. CG8]MQB51698.1 5-oxoprolinase subunit PxpB [Rahnella sp. RcJ3]QBJ08471.1 5-oxoprolinase subunit PxpB [Rahnella aquatilis]ADW74754.1 Allophanate hydrolase subunit 1 [Rahnella aceris]
MQRARCYLLGERAVVLELEPPVSLVSQQRIWGLTQRLQDRAAYPGVREVIPGMNNLTVLLSEAQSSALDAIERLQNWWEESEAIEPESRLIEIPVIYGGTQGPDLDNVARHTGMTPRQVVECHAGADYIVYFLGFQPGFPYLGGMPSTLATPRHGEPRLSVPAGSVGIGGSQTGIYPLETPGGWQLIGQSLIAMFDPLREQPTLLLPGDSVRFVPQKEGVC